MKQILISCILLIPMVYANAAPRERLSMNFGWKFALGHATDITRDFNLGTSYFTYLAKAGYGDGAASPGFDDRAWRRIDLPHDWAVEAGFSPYASHSHGYKAVGLGFPEASVGWYRKTFYIPEEDFGKRIILEFEGVMRDAKVWVNGFYCGNEPSGYSSFAFDITEYLNYGGYNVVAVRADVTMKEGWFYEGAGIYRHVWLHKVLPLHIPLHGTYVTSQVRGNRATVNAEISVTNKSLQAQEFSIRNRIIDPKGNVLKARALNRLTLNPRHSGNYTVSVNVADPMLWDIDAPNLYTLVTTIYSNGEKVDEYSTTFGIRTIHWDPKRGFFLNGRHVKLKGTNNHQNHAGVGAAIPDALHEWRLRQLKYMGSNAIRMAHYPPSPALLDAADRLGMLVINENRLMGTTDEKLDHLRRLMVRDRNHPSIILWSLGNEEWAIEGNDRGAWITQQMQAFARKFDTTRPLTVALSGWGGAGISGVNEVMGFNYLRNGCTDTHHARFPWQPSLGTEEGSTNTTRGIYFDDMERQFLAAYDRPTPSGFKSIQHGWRHYAERDYLAGVFIWTGFDYRGESTPFRWPSVSTYFGMFDLCGFPKDNVYYLRSWWSDEPVLHVFPHWNWPGKEGEEIDVWVYSNFDEVELFLNGNSLGRQTMPTNGHLEWAVSYAPGTLKAIGYRNGTAHKVTTVSTTGAPASVQLLPSTDTIAANAEDISVITVGIADQNGMPVPDANLPVTFSLSGPGRIIGVGNGNPTSHEPCRFFETIYSINFGAWREIHAEDININVAVLPGFDCSAWNAAFPNNGLMPGSQSEPTLYRSTFALTEEDLKGSVTWMFRSIGANQSVWVNGHLLARDLSEEKSVFVLDKTHLNAGNNVVAILANPFVRPRVWDVVNTNPGEIQIEIGSQPWQRKTFNGLAQVIVQSTGDEGNIVLRASSPGLNDAILAIPAAKAPRRVWVR